MAPPTSPHKVVTASLSLCSIIGGVTVALKNGWLPLTAGNSDWQVNSVGWVSGDGRSYLMAVLSTGNPSEQYGIDTLSHLGAMVWSALAPHG